MFASLRTTMHQPFANILQLGLPFDDCLQTRRHLLTLAKKLVTAEPFAVAPHKSESVTDSGVIRRKVDHAHQVGAGLVFQSVAFTPISKGEVPLDIIRRLLALT